MMIDKLCQAHEFTHRFVLAEHIGVTTQMLHLPAACWLPMTASRILPGDPLRGILGYRARYPFFDIMSNKRREKDQLF